MPSRSVKLRVGSAAIFVSGSARSVIRRAALRYAAHPERVGVLEFEKIGDFIEDRANIAVVHAAMIRRKSRSGEPSRTM